MAEAHLEMDDGSTLPLISVCHAADKDRALPAGCYRLERGAELSNKIPSSLLRGLPGSKRNEKLLMLAFVVGATRGTS